MSLLSDSFPVQFTTSTPPFHKILDFRLIKVSEEVFNDIVSIKWWIAQIKAFTWV